MKPPANADLWALAAQLARKYRLRLATPREARRLRRLLFPARRAAR